jgi:hypothetical protein
MMDLAAVCDEFLRPKLVYLPCKRLQNDDLGVLLREGKNVSRCKKELYYRADVGPCGRLANRVQIATDGLKAYVTAVEDAFGGEVDYAILSRSLSPLSGDLPPSQLFPRKPGRG